MTIDWPNVATRSLAPAQIAMVLAFAVLSCSSAKNSRDRVTDFTPAYPKNYLVVHDGKPTAFAAAKCYVLTASDEDAHIDISLYIDQLFAERLPTLPRCRDNEWPRVELAYYAGYGVCIDCGGTKRDARSAFAGIALAARPQQYVASAEWQYWRGGSAQLVAQQLVFDLSNLIINALEKPPPRVPSELQ